MREKRRHDPTAKPNYPPGEAQRDDEGDVASEDSFPASDPPSFTGTTA